MASPVAQWKWHGNWLKARENKDRAIFHSRAWEGLLKVLTPNRWRLLRALRNHGPLSVRALAQLLDRAIGACTLMWAC